MVTEIAQAALVIGLVFYAYRMRSAAKSLERELVNREMLVSIYRERWHTECVEAGDLATVLRSKNEEIINLQQEVRRLKDGN